MTMRGTRGEVVDASPFEWVPMTAPTDTEPTMQSDWNGWHLVADFNGRWSVGTRTHGSRISSNTQAPGIDLQDAMQRAQAAAMILHQLRTF